MISNVYMEMRDEIGAQRKFDFLRNSYWKTGSEFLKVMVGR